jgi:hypothetical protein
MNLFLKSSLKKYNSQKLINGSFSLSIITLLLFNPITETEALSLQDNEELKWQTIFLASNPACSNYDYQMLNKYSAITEKYLQLYNLENLEYDHHCFSSKDYFSKYQQPADLDLVIIILDSNLGENFLHNQKIGGLYTHSGIDRTQNNVIVICDCSNFEYSDPVWILSHELSHFVLYYLGYDSDIVEDLVHSQDSKYDQCREKYVDSCIQIRTKLKLDNYAYSVNVMPIYEQAENQEVVNDLSDTVLELAKNNTKNWINGNITDNDYVNSLEAVTEYLLSYTNNETEVLFTEEPNDPYKITWEEINSENVYDKEDEFLFQLIQSYIKEEKFKTQEVNIGLPVWFNETASNWITGTITNELLLNTKVD